MTSYYMAFYPSKYETPEEAKAAGELKRTGSDMSMGRTQFWDMFETISLAYQVSNAVNAAAYCITNEDMTEFYEVEDME